jgi:hypothetical protein
VPREKFKAKIVELKKLLGKRAPAKANSENSAPENTQDSQD